MAKWKDLRGFIKLVEQLGELRHVQGAHWDKEVGAITELMALSRGPALLFDEIIGYPKGYRIFSNAMATYKQTAIVLGLSENLKPIEMLDAWRKKIRNPQLISSMEVKTSALKENIHTGTEIDLYEFPTPRWHDLDGGRYLGTGCGVITRDPDEGWVNLGTYRCMIQDKNHISVKLNKGKHGRIMMEKYHAKGKSCPIAISIGLEPTLWIACTVMLPWGISEYEFAGKIKGEPIEVVEGEATDLPLPAAAEIVLEGEIPPLESMKLPHEGPFGEWTGYYADSTDGVVPLMEVKSVLHRNNPIITGAPPLAPPAVTHYAIPLRAGLVWDALEGAGIPDVKGVWNGPGSNIMWQVVAIKQRYAGHAKQAGMVAATCRPGAYGGKFTIVVDEDVDITNFEEVIWALSTRCNAETIEIIKDIWTSPADPALEEEKRNKEDNVNAKVIINGCRPYSHLKDFAPISRFSSEYQTVIKNKWKELFSQ